MKEKDVPNGEAPYPMPKTPANLVPFVEVLGVGVTVDFLLRFGGASMSFPKRRNGRSDAEAFLGAELHARLCERRDDLPRRIPLARPWIAQVMRAGGYAVAEIARKIGATDVTIRKWLKMPSRGVTVKTLNGDDVR